MKLSSILTVLFWFAAAAGAQDQKNSAHVSIVVSIVPQVFFVEQIGGSRVQVEAIVQPGHNPHTYEPTPRQLALLSGADVYFSIGVAFEKGFIPKLKNLLPKLLVIDTSRGVPLRSMKSDRGDPSSGRSKNTEKHHEHGEDPHIWLSPQLVVLQARTIRDTLVALDPEGKDIYETNTERFMEKLQQLDRELQALLSDLPSRKFMVYHPAWGYFADAYRLEQIEVETEGKTPAAKQLARIIDQAKREGVKVVFTQPQFSMKSAETIADSIDGKVVPIDPLAEDIFANLKSVAESIREAVIQ